MWKAYRVDWDDFLLWCDTHGRPPMPATPETVVEYLEGLANAKVATHQAPDSSSISCGPPDAGPRARQPTRSGLVTTSIQGIRRTLRTAQTQKAPLVTAELIRLVAACEQLPHPLMTARDRALLLIGCSGGFRRSELVALNVADITETADGLELTLHHSKTDQEGGRCRGRRPLRLPSAHLPGTLAPRLAGPLGDIRGPDLWREIDRHGTMGAGRLHADSVNRIIKRACTLRRAGPRQLMLIRSLPALR